MQKLARRLRFVFLCLFKLVVLALVFTPISSVANNKIFSCNQLIKNFSLENLAPLKNDILLDKWSTDFQHRLALDLGIPNSHGEILTQLGFKLVQEPINLSASEKISSPYTAKQMSATHKVVPPMLSELMHNYHRIMQSYVEKGIIKEQDVLWPSLRFEKKVFYRSRPKIQNILIGVEKIPENWNLSTKGSIDFIEFAKMVKSGYFPMLVNSNFIVHDLGHTTDHIANPKKMAIVKRIYSEFIDYIYTKNSKFDFYNFRERMEVLDEFFSVPQISQKKVIRQMFEPLFLKNISDFSSAYKYYYDLVNNDKTELLNTAQQLVDKSNLLFIKSGGAIRDGISFEAEFKRIMLLGNSFRHGRLERIFSGQYSIIPENVRESGTPYCLSVNILVIKKALEMLDQATSEQNNAILPFESSILNEHFYKFLAFHTAALGISLKNAVDLNITLEKLVSELGFIDKPDFQSDSMKFIKNSFPEDHPYHQIFIEKPQDLLSNQ